MTAKEYEKSDLVRFSKLSLLWSSLSFLSTYIRSLQNATKYQLFHLHNVSLKIVNFTEIF